MSSNKHSASKPLSAKQAHLNGIFSKHVPTTASSDVCISALVTPTPTDSPVDFPLPSELIKSVARDSD